MLWLSLCAVCCGAVTTEAEEDLQVLRTREGEPSPSEMMPAYLIALAEEALDRRAETFESLKTMDDWTAYQEKMRAFFVEQLGGFPERTPLNPRVIDRQTRDGYRFEKVIYESLPRFHVTAVLYLPLSDPPYPGVLVPCGHSSNGKGAAAYQRACTLLARNGFAVLCYDPVDQGERYQLLNDDGTPKFGGTFGHTMIGVGSMLVGRNTASYRVWDGIRSIDYLAGRDEVDPERIGCTGNSGGGTLTSYLMALDPRIRCAAPSCYLTSFRALINTIGPQDSEQDIYGQIAFGMDHADYVLMRAPRPTLICAATRDFFDITGTWGAFRQAKRCYTQLGYSERVDLVEANETHGFSTLLRQGMVRWMRRWLLGVDDAVVDDPEFPVLTDEEIQCTPEGQVMLLEGARTVYDLNVELETELAGRRRDFWQNRPADKALAKVRETTGIRPLADLPEAECESVGRLERDGYTIEKLVLRTEPGIALPALLFQPQNAQTGDAYLYVDGDGKYAAAAPGGPVENLAATGAPVLAVDLRGIGETEHPMESGERAEAFGTAWKDTLLAYLIGKSYLAMRAEDVLVCARWLAARETGATPNRVHLIAVGEAGPPALHAAALEPDLFATVRLERSLVSWSEVVRTPITRNQLVNAVHGVLRVYDLPDLASTLPPDKLTIVDPLDAAGGPAGGMS